MARKLHGPIQVPNFPRHFIWHNRAPHNWRVRWEICFSLELEVSATVERRKSTAHPIKERPCTPEQTAWLMSMLPASAKEKLIRDRILRDAQQ